MTFGAAAAAVSAVDWTVAAGTVVAALASAVAAVAAWKAASSSTELAQAARRQQLDDERRHLSHGAALSLLPVIHELRRTLPDLRFVMRLGLGPQEDIREAHAAQAALEEAGQVHGPLLADEQVHRRVRELVRLTFHYRQWSDDELHNVLRARVDVDRYAEYVRDSLVALLHRTEPPAEVAPPHVGRAGDEPWHPSTGG